MNYFLVFLTSFVGAGVGGWLILNGLAKHLGDRFIARLNHDLSKQLKEHEAALSGPTHMTQLQLDAELAAIRDVLAKAGRVRLSFKSLRPRFTVEVAGMSNVEKLNSLWKRLERCNEDLNQLVEAVESVFALVPQDFYDEVAKMIGVANAEIMIIQMTAHQYFYDGLPVNEVRKEWWQDAEQNLKDFDKHYLNTSKIVKSRFQNLSLIPDRRVDHISD